MLNIGVRMRNGGVWVNLHVAHVVHAAHAVGVVRAVPCSAVRRNSMLCSAVLCFACCTSLKNKSRMRTLYKNGYSA